jgi:hypothetical protein
VWVKSKIDGKCYSPEIPTQSYPCSQSRAE